jgi:hypothetical protein
MSSVGVILYELYVGQPPFYTNSIYSLINHIVKDPVKYPTDISKDFKTFLQGTYLSYSTCMYSIRVVICNTHLTCVGIRVRDELTGLLELN